VALLRRHTYDIQVAWTGNLGTGTSGYRAYARSVEVTCAGLPAIAGSADPSFRGDATRWNPEQLLVASLSQCHLLSYLHVCSDAGVVVVEYTDHAVGVMELVAQGGHFTEVVLRPVVVVADAAMAEAAAALHEDAHRACFIAASVNFPVRHEPAVTVRAASEV
jgi:organic hydroperoxide reductase OsmC/OhrA